MEEYQGENNMIRYRIAIFGMEHVDFY